MAVKKVFAQVVYRWPTSDILNQRMTHAWWKLRTPTSTLVISMLLSCGLLATSAVAQTLPSTADPARVLQDQQQILPETTAKPSPVSPSPVFEYQAPADGVPTFTLREIIFSGNTVLNDAELENIVQPYVAQPVSIETLQGLAEQLTILYRQQGYILSKVVVPAQEIREGSVQLVVEEKGLTSVTIEAEDRLRNLPSIANIKERLLKSSPLNIAALERALLTLNSYPGIEATSVLGADDAGGIQLVINITQQRLAANARIDNRNSRFVGPWIGTVLGSINGLTTGLDQLSFSGLQSAEREELSALGLDYELPLGSDGLALTLSAFQLWSEPGFTLRDLDIENTSYRLSAQLSYPLQRSRSTNTSVYGRLQAFEAESKSFGTIISEDRLRIANVGITHDWADATGGATIIQTEVHQGIPALGAVENGDRNLTRQHGKVDFTKFDVYAARTQPLDDNLQFFAAVNGQYSLDQLLSPEEFGYGGAQFGRGYDPSEIAGDHGVAGLLELRHTSFNKLITADYLQSFISYDYGAIWRRDGSTQPSTETGSSGAIGVRTRLFDTLNLEAMLAKPLTRGVSSIGDSSDQNNPRAYFSISANW